MKGPIDTRRRLVAATLWTVTLLAMNALAEPRESTSNARELTVSAIVLPHCVVERSAASNTASVTCRHNGSPFSLSSAEHPTTAIDTDERSSIIEVRF